MELTYTWKLISLKKTNYSSAELNNVVVQTYWECTGTNADGISGTFPGATSFDPDVVDAENFTTYENLTEAQVIGWIQDVVENNPGYKTHIEAQIKKQIDDIVRPTVNVYWDALPWVEPISNIEPEVTENIYTGPET